MHSAQNVHSNEQMYATSVWESACSHLSHPVFIFSIGKTSYCRLGSGDVELLPGTAGRDRSNCCYPARTA